MVAGVHLALSSKVLRPGETACMKMSQQKMRRGRPRHTVGMPRKTRVTKPGRTVRGPGAYGRLMLVWSRRRILRQRQPAAAVRSAARRRLEMLHRMGAGRALRVLRGEGLGTAGFRKRLRLDRYTQECDNDSTQWERAVVAHHWIAVTEPAFPWEREALSYIRERLPEQEPFHAWSNFEFVADDGSINEVDLLVVSLYKLYLVEIKSRPGRVSGDAGTWTWNHAGRVYADDNPLLLTNRKAKKLKALLQRQKALHNVRLPYVEPVVFLSAPDLHCDLTGAARTGIYLRQGTEAAGYPDIMTVLTGTAERPASVSGALPPRIDRRLSQAIGRAIEQTGIRPSQRAQRVGDYRLERLLRENDAYQDWEATHVRFPKITRRIRIYPQALRATALSRTAQRQAAEREYVLLEGLHHAGILKAEGFTEHERGPALIFEHEPEAERFDLFLRARGETLDIDQRLALVRQLAETLQYAHAHRLYHRALSPQTILITAAGEPPTPGENF